ncbi:hypothetical protein BDR26DRAFT_864271 [Obelidium mucronatum]|nr:hypothetical protein BDR26DRAFT_864271 [Obelidium mucronatum]
MQLLPALLVLVATVSAHFVINTPTSRPFDEDRQTIGPCGGLPLGKRTAFPLVGGIVSGALYHPSALANFSIVISNTDPTASQFGKAPIGPGFNVKLTEGPFSTDPIDLTKVSGAVDGANATIQVAINTVDGILFICSDVKLDKSLSKGSSASSPQGVATTAGGKVGGVAAVGATAATSTTTATATSLAKSNAFVNSAGISLMAVAAASLTF